MDVDAPGMESRIRWPLLGPVSYAAELRGILLDNGEISISQVSAREKKVYLSLA